MKSVPRLVVGAFALLIAAGIIVGLFAMEIPGGNRDVAMVSLGIALGWAGAVVQFYFGSSEGSKAKTDIMASGPSQVEVVNPVNEPVHVENV